MVAAATAATDGNGNGKQSREKKCEPRQSGRYTEPDSTMFSCSHSYSVCSTHATGKIFSPIIIRARLL